MAKPETIWLFGCGNMAGAMLSRWLNTGMRPGDVTVIDPALPMFAGVRTLGERPHEPPPAWLLLAVKPQMLDAVAPDVAQAVGPETTLLSILAGIPLARLEERFAHAGRIVRVMPNMPVRIGRGAVALHARDVARAPIDALFAPLGSVEWIDDDRLFDAVTALSGSGPAFLYRFAEALAKGGVALGLDTAQADRLARVTVEGAALLAAQSTETLETLANRVASKGGSTREGLDILDENHALAVLVEAALRAAEMRNHALAG